MNENRNFAPTCMIDWSRIPVWAWPAPRPERCLLDAGMLESRSAEWEQRRALKLARRRLGNANGVMMLWHLCMLVIQISAMLIGFAASELETAMGYGYLLFGILSPLLVLIWKKPRYYRTHVFAKRGSPSLGLVLLWVLLLLGIQGASDVVQRILRPITSLFGDGSAAVEPETSWQMIVYTAVLAPIGEEILFRGLLLRTAQPYGRRLAIFTSAMFFALMHGNQTQGIFAFCFGLLAAYVTLEYSIVWAMLLHFLNNSLLAYGLSALMQSMNTLWQLFTILAVFYLPMLASIILLIVKHRNISAYLRQERPLKLWKKAYFSAPWTIVALVVFGLNVVFCLLALGI